MEIETGEYFLKQNEKVKKKHEEKKRKQEEKTQERKAEREKAFKAPKEMKKISGDDGQRATKKQATNASVANIKVCSSFK